MMEAQNIPEQDSSYGNKIPIDSVGEIMERVRKALHTIIVGQEVVSELLLTALLADGHVLLEGVPGVAKTLTAKTLAKLIRARFNRIQFTPDLMPSDVLGTNVFNPQTAHFEFKQGPIFGNIILIDEINRAPAKTQAALFEVMEERQVSSDGQVFTMEPPFLVIATQNPIEHEGTYRLPEAQLDRFLFKIEVDYPSPAEELHMLQNHHQRGGQQLLPQLQPVVSTEELAFCRSVVGDVTVDEKILKYITQITAATREHQALYLGASPRASIALLNAAKALAVLRGRGFVTPEDVQYVCPPVLRHRIALTPDREMEGATADDVLKEITTRIEVPR